MKRSIGPFVLVAVMTAALAAGAAEPRSIVFILVDDQRFDALGMLNPFFETPNLDRLARNGVIFHNAFVTTSLCSPSRASILSGQWAHKHGVLDNATPLPADTPTFPQELQKAGYETAFIGKWHMGGTSDAPRPGFDHWVSFRGQGVYKDPTFNVDGKSVKHEGYVTDIITDYAEAYLERPKSKPFMLYVSHKAVHAEFQPAARHEGVYGGRTYPYPESMADTDENYRGKPEWVRKQRNTWHGVDGMFNNTVSLDDFTRRYAETLKGVDDSVGRIMDKLEALGRLESTVIIFTSDNGFQFGEHGLIDKRTMYEASIRVPLIVHCPNLVAGGQHRSQMVLNADFSPTILALAGADIPASVQGRSFLDVLLDEKAPGRKAFLYTYFWERMFPQTPTVLGVRTERYKYMQYHGLFGRYELYDLKEDPHEQHNMLADFYTTTEVGNVEYRVMGSPSPRYRSLFGDKKADPELRAVFNEVQRALREELTRLECAMEPNWRPPNTQR